ncbi:MAG TPA: TrmH family RNA methyltransferase [Anaerolineaceae bacterium]|nr:TrmH family RNA methyltransferase [Anaerolineaceae bacterium]
MKPASAIWFMQCQNPSCRLRFPLDLAEFKGAYCPRCGGDLLPAFPALPQSHPMANPLTNTNNLNGILDNIRSAQNVGALFRTADGAGLQKLWLCGITPNPADNAQIAKTALGAEQTVPWEHAPSTVALVEKLKTQGVIILGLETAPGSTSLFSYTLPKSDKTIALVVGSEPAGIDPAVLPLADATLNLPMAGSKGSLNVAVAFGIAVYFLRFGARG